MRPISARWKCDIVVASSDEVSFIANASDARGAAAASVDFTVWAWDIPCHAPPERSDRPKQTGHTPKTQRAAG
ncbi:hypothetical protein GCM10007880_32180 [Mesorhizobium amorphae]|nr:hypothetical protein GCM10007880_32180 [Mesorhizobium amorphae]